MECHRIADLFSGCDCRQGALTSRPAWHVTSQILTRPFDLAEYESFGYSHA